MQTGKNIIPVCIRFSSHSQYQGGNVRFLHKQVYLNTLLMFLTLDGVLIQDNALLR